MDSFDVLMLSNIKYKDKAIEYVNKYFAIQLVDKHLNYYEFNYANSDLNQIMTHTKASIMNRLKHGYIIIRGRKHKIYKLWVDDPNRRMISQDQVNMLYSKVGGLPTELKTDIILILDALKNYLGNLIAELLIVGDALITRYLFLEDFFEHYELYMAGLDADVNILAKNKYMRELDIYLENNNIEVQRVRRNGLKKGKKEDAIEVSLQTLLDLVSGGEEEFCIDDCPYFGFQLEADDFKEVKFDTARPTKTIFDIYATYSLLKLPNKFGYDVIYRLRRSGEAEESELLNVAETLLRLRVRNTKEFEALFSDNINGDPEISIRSNLGEKKSTYYTHSSNDDDYMKQKVMQSYCLHCINLG